MLVLPIYFFLFTIFFLIYLFQRVYNIHYSAPSAQTTLKWITCVQNYLWNKNNFERQLFSKYNKFTEINFRCTYYLTLLRSVSGSTFKRAPHPGSCFLHGVVTVWSYYLFKYFYVCTKVKCDESLKVMEQKLLFTMFVM